MDDEVEHEIKFKFERLLCMECIHFEDSELKKLYFYNRRGQVRGTYEVRFYCHCYREYLTKFYSICIKFDDGIKSIGGRK